MMVKKTALAKKTGAKTDTTKNRRGQTLAKKTGAKTNRRGQTDPLLGSGWHAWLEHVRNQGP
eukprot:3261105-Lingulodinium_polyedra.AAC.1